MPGLKEIRARTRLLARAWRYRRKLDPDEIGLVLRTLRRGDWALDIGAHKGAYTYWMQRSVGPTGRVIAFEPQPRLAASLRRSLGSRRYQHVVIEQMGLSATPGQMELHVPQGGPSPGATLEVTGNGTNRDTYTIPVETLDSYFSKRDTQPIRLIKCDVEGHELAVFRGGRDLLAAHKPLLLFECEARHHQHDTMDDVFAFLEQTGYAGYFHMNGRLTPRTQFDAARHQVVGTSPYINNFVFIHERDRNQLS